MGAIRRVAPSEAPELEKVRIMKYLCEQKGLYKHHMFISLGWYLALRVKEVCGVKFSDFNLKERELFVRAEISKGGYSDGYVEIDDQSFLNELNTFKGRFGYSDTDFVLNHSPARKPFTTRQAFRLAKQVGKFVGFPGFYPHMLRHSRARWLLENGYNYKYVQIFLRHRDPVTTLKMYAHFDKASMKRQTDEGRKGGW